MPLPQSLRNDKIKRLFERLLARIAEYPLGTRIPNANDAGSICRNDCVGTTGEQGLGHYGGNVQRTHSLAGILMKSRFEGRHVGPEMHAGLANLRLSDGETCPNGSLA
jgi:hypothetical protein